MSISTLINNLPKRYTYSDRIQNFATEKSKAIIANAIKSPQAFLNNLGFNQVEIQSVNTTDGLRITLEDTCIIHLRPSGNAPERVLYS